MFFSNRWSPKEVEHVKALTVKYPFLRVKDPVASDTWTDSWLFDLEDGWRKAFGDDLCKELDAAIKEDKCEDTFEFVQIKEKFGALRLYAWGYGKKVGEVLAKYEELSKYICGHCGQPATRISKGWIYPFCDPCVDKVHQKSVPIEEFYGMTTQEIADEIENIKTNFRYEDYWKKV